MHTEGDAWRSTNIENAIGKLHGQVSLPELINTMIIVNVLSLMCSTMAGARILTIAELL